MKLTFKLVFAIIALIVLILGADAYLSVNRESEFLEKELEKKNYQIGNELKELVAEAWRRNGQTGAMQLVEAANDREKVTIIRWVWLDEPGDNRYGPRVSPDQLNKVIQRETVTMRYQGPDGRSSLVTYMTVNVGNRPGALELTEPLSVPDEFVKMSIYRKVVLILAVLAGTLVVTLLLGIWLVGWPLKELTEKARRVGAGDLSGPIKLKGRNELSELATTLNEMCDRLAESHQQTRQETEARLEAIELLRHSDRLRTVGQLASGIAHELGTPLNVVSGRASLITSGRLAPEAVAESAGIIKTQAERMAGIIRKLLDFSRSSTPHRTDTDLLQIVRETAQILEPLSRKHGVELVLPGIPNSAATERLENTVEASSPADTAVPANPSAGADNASSVQPTMICCVDAGQIQQVLTNLIVNAIQATPSGGRVTLSAAEEHRRPPTGEIATERDYYRLTVADTGAGLADDVKSRLFEPFVTTKDIGQGTGLGLSIAYGIVREHGGWISVESEIGRGSRFDVYLPRRSNECQDES